MPITVPRNPNMGPAPDIMANKATPFSSLLTSKLPTFSMAVCMSLSGFPIRDNPFSIIREMGVLSR